MGGSVLVMLAGVWWVPGLLWEASALHVLPQIRCEATTLETKSMVWPVSTMLQNQLLVFGEYVAEILPKYVQQVQVTCFGELEIL